jgi:glycosyltransferase involved in cell wall biosynthesis
MDMMRVAMTFEQCWHEVPGGTAVYALELARALSNLDDVEIAGVAARHARPPDDAWRPPVEVDHLALPRLALYESWHYLRRPSVQRATGSVDVVHATSLAVPPRSAPLVVTVHDLAWRSDPKHSTRRGVSFHERGLAIARVEADLVLCPSSATLHDCVGAGIDENRLRITPLGVRAHSQTEAAVAEVRHRHGLDRPYVLWTGTVEPRKNLAGLLAAWRQVESEADLVLAGPVGWNQDLDRLVGADRARVKALGFIPRSDLGPLYAGATLFCWPSLKEGFGLPVLEAMAQGIPVVTSRGTSTEEVAGEAGMLVDPRDPAAIAKAISRLLADETLARSLGEAGRERARTFSWARTAERTLAAYKEVA